MSDLQTDGCVQRFACVTSANGRKATGFATIEDPL